MQLREPIDLFQPLLASFVAGSATAIGGLVVFFLKRAPDDRQVSFSLSFSAGVMIVVSVLDLWFPSLFKRPVVTIVSAACGYLLCVVLGKLPIPGAEELFLQAHAKLTAMSAQHSGQQAVASTSLSAVTVQHGSSFEGGRGSGAGSDEDDEERGEDATGQAGAASHGSPRRQRSIAHHPTKAPAFQAQPSSRISPGASAIDISMAPPAASPPPPSQPLRPRTGALMRLGVLMCIILSLHNLPEGVAVLASSAKSQSLGLVVALAIFIHNVAEGLSVAIPIYGATGDRWLALGLTALSGMTEPLGALLAGLLLNRYTVSTSSSSPTSAGAGIGIDSVVDVVLCFVGGIMVNVSFGELIPSAMAFSKGDKTFVMQGMACGGVLIALSLLAL